MTIKKNVYIDSSLHTHGNDWTTFYILIFCNQNCLKFPKSLAYVGIWFNKDNF